MIADLHTHYVVHLEDRKPFHLGELLRSSRERRRLGLHVRAALMRMASRFANYRTFFSGPRVRVDYMCAGGVGVVLSALYSFFDEFDVGDGPTPEVGYLLSVEHSLALVEDDVGPREDAVVASSPAELEEALADQKLALVHCVEGGFHLGPTPDDVRTAVDRLADLGVAYITLAHLIYREVATNASALPFMTDTQYERWFPQPPETGLAELGIAAVEKMIERGVLIDLSHMSERALGDTFDLLDDLDPERDVPVLATHAGYRFGGRLEYMLSDEALGRIGERDGVVGLILAQHQMKDVSCTTSRVPAVTKRRRFERSFDILCCHIDHICEATGSHRHVGIGSDFDGFIKPTLPGIEDMRDMAWLEAALKARYGEHAQGICSGNALRPLTTYWQGTAPAG